MPRNAVTITILSSILVYSFFFASPRIAISSSMVSATNATAIQEDLQSTMLNTSSNSTETKKIDNKELLSTETSHEYLVKNLNSTLSETDSSSKNILTKTIEKEQEESNVHTDKDPNASLALILKSIQLSQGQDGSELWRLNAKAAQMEQLEENFLVESPQLTYIMKPKDTELHVSSNKGIINQKEQVLQFKDNVLITHLENRIKGNLLIYNGTQKTMTFPEGGSFIGEKIKGSANIILWHLDTQKIEANGNVTIIFSSNSSK